MTVASPTLAETQRTRILTSFGQQGLLRGMGARIIALDSGRCVIALPFSEAVSQQHGFFHGGAIGALADTAAGYAAMSTAPEDADVVTLEYKINFLRPAVGDRLVAEGIVLRAGRSVTVTRADVYTVTGETRALCAAMQQSIMLAPAAPAR